VVAFAFGAGALYAIGGLRKKFRTRRDIDAEILALRIVRGDFDAINDEQSRRASAMRILREETVGSIKN
jgi:hypothetical protein